MIRRVTRFLMVTVMTFALASSVMAGCISGGDEDDSGDGDAVLTLTAEDSGGTFDVVQGQTLVITVTSNPTTGFEWAVDELSPAVLTYIGSSYSATDDGLLGQGGTQRLSFQAANPGQATLALKYWRSWEGDSSIDQRYSVTINVVGQ